jgi:hypothetical protein
MSKDVNIKFKADSSDAQKGIKGVQSELNKFSKSGLEQTIKGVQKLGKTIKGLGISAVIAAEIKILKQYLATIKETAQAYNKQIDAEKGLERAAKNNPYINGEGVKNLKSFAKELERTAAIEDNQSLEVMRQLVATGRTEAEVMQIMSAAVDYAAGANLDLATAAKQLNATYSGSAGLLGKQSAAVKALTKEQLANGEAVKIVAEQYKGMAVELANTDTKLELAKKTFKEAMGEITQPSYEGWNKFWTKIYEDGVKTFKALDMWSQNIADKLTLKDVLKEIDKVERRAVSAREEIIGGVRTSTANYIEDLVDANETDVLEALKRGLELRKEKNKLSGVERTLLERVNNELRIRANREEYLQEEEKKQQELQEKKNKALAKENELNAVKEKNEKDLNKKLDDMEREANLRGEVVDKQAVLNEMVKSYIDLLNNGISENDPFAEEKRKEIEEYAKWMEKLEKDANKTKKELEQLKQVLDDMSDFLSQYEQLTKDATDLFLNSIQEEKNAELGDLAEQYNEGLITYEDYCNKKQEIEEEAAKKEYKLRMWEWTANLATATANIAQGITKSLSEYAMPLAAVMAAMTGAAGAIQIAALIANKPKPPSFATGGIVPGTSYTGDRVQANVNSGEMILNSAQQARLWQLANSGSGNGGGGTVVNMPVTIENKNGSNVQTQMNKNGLRVIIDNAVNSSMGEGRYNASMQEAQSKQKGVSYL